MVEEIMMDRWSKDVKKIAEEEKEKRKRYLKMRDLRDYEECKEKRKMMKYVEKKL